MKGLVEVVEKLVDDVMHTKESVCIQYGGYVYKESFKQRGVAARLGYEMDDVVSEGYIGLLKAFDRFDGEQFGTRFSSFAIPYISGSISNALRKTNTGAHYPQDIKSLGYRIKREGLMDLTPEEVAEKLNTKPHLVTRAREFLTNRFPVLLDQQIDNSEGESISWLDGLASSSDDSVSAVNDFLNKLTQNERLIVSGLDIGLNQTEIGMTINFTQVRVSRAITEIRNKYVSYFGDGNIKTEAPKRRNRKK